MSQSPDHIGLYRILGELGEGGMGVVFKACHRETGQEVALKTVRVPRARTVQSLRREIEGLSRLRHPGIVRIVEHGLWQDIPWYAMELLEGQPLRDWMGGAGWLPTLQPTLGSKQQTSEAMTDSFVIPRQTTPARPRGLSALQSHGLPAVLGLMRRLCGPLAFLHAQGLVHRDLKPENILLKIAPSSLLPVLMDFGLVDSWEARDKREELYLDGGVLGTAQYMAPEQIRGELCDARADLYALGCLFYEMLCGQPPFVGDSAAEVLGAHLLRTPLPPSQLVVGQDPRLDDLVLRLLAKWPRDRLGSAEALAAELERLGAEPVEGKPIVARGRRLFRPGLVGRSAELETLRRSVRPGSGAGCVVMIAGESGLGKTRLLLELGRELVSGQALVLTGEGRKVGGEPLQAMRRPLQAIADRCLEWPSAEAEALLGNSGSTLALFEPRLAGAGGTKRGTKAEVTAVQLYGHLARLCIDLARRQPLVVLLDDLQWADPLLLGWLEFLLDNGWLQGADFFLVGTYRSEEVGEPLRQFLTRKNIVLLELQHLEPRSIEALASDMLGEARLPQALQGMLARQAEGNPFFVAEYLRTAVDQGLLRLDAQGRWSRSGTQDDTALPLPGSLRELLERRLAGLSPAALELALATAVLGIEADPRFAASIGGLGEVELQEGLGELIRRDVLAENQAGQIRYTQDRLREIAYGKLDPARRPEAHRRAAEALEQDDLQTWLAEVGRHRELAGDLVVARQLYCKAGQKEMQRSALAEAERLFLAHLRLTPEPDAQSLEVRNTLGARVYRRLGRMEAARLQHEQAMIEARSLGDQATECESLRLQAIVLHETGRLLEAEALYGQTLTMSRAIGAYHSEARVLNNLANLWGHQGRREQSEQGYRAALESSRQHGISDLEASVLGNLAIDCMNVGDYLAAEDYFRRCVTLHRQRDETGSEGYALGNLANLYQLQGRLEEARQACLEALQVQRARGDLRDEARIQGNLAIIEKNLGRWSQAEALCHTALLGHRRSGYRRGEGLVLGALAQIEMGLGKIAQARQTLASSLEIRKQLGNRLLLIPLHLDAVELERRTSPTLESAWSVLELARQAIEDAGNPSMDRDLWLCQRGVMELAEGRTARHWLAEALQRSGPATAELQQIRQRLATAQALFEAGRIQELHRGEPQDELPGGLRQWLISQDLLAAAISQDEPEEWSLPG